MSDLIDRQAAIETILKLLLSEEDSLVESVEECNSMIEGAADILKSLPSAQPEVIHCRDCRWWDKDEDGGSPYGYCRAMKHGYMSANWEIGIYRRYKGDFYCADAEWEGDE